MIRWDRRVTTAICVSPSDTRFTIVILVAVVVVPSASFLSRVSVELILLQKIAVIRNTIGYRLEVIRCTSRG